MKRKNSIFFKHKKGALEVSINAIIILIFAIAILALGLTFIRNMFTKTSGEFGQVTAQVKNDLINELKASNEKLAISPLTVEVDKTTKKGEVYYGVRNIFEDTKTFDVTIDECVPITGGETAVKLVYTYETIKVPAGETEVQPALVTITSSTVETSYKCTLTITDTDGTDLYASKPFFVNVVK